MKALLILIVTLLTGCTGIPEGITAVDGFEINRYLGAWYEIARLDHRFERGLENISATYTLREDGGVDVLNKGWDIQRPANGSRHKAKLIFVKQD